jgi:hypothetical protein
VRLFRRRPAPVRADEPAPAPLSAQAMTASDQ